MPPLKRSLLFSSLVAALLTGCGNDEEQTPVQTETNTKPSLSSTEQKSDNASKAVDMLVRDVSIRLWQGRQAVAVTLSTPVAMDKPLDDWLDIETDKGEGLEGGWVADQNGKVIYFAGLEPEARYRVKVKPGIEGQNGQVLKQGTELDLETPALNSALGFASRGNLLAHRLREGLPVMAVNVSEVDLDVYRIDADALDQFLSGYGQLTQLGAWDAQELKDDAELVWSGRFDLELEKNTRATRYLPVQDMEPLQEAGVYLAVMREAGGIEYRYPATWFTVTDLGAQVRLYPDQLRVQVNSLATTEAVRDVQLQLLDEKGRTLLEASTDSKGQAVLDADQLKQGTFSDARLLLLKQDRQLSLVRLKGQGLDLAEFPVDGPVRSAQEVFIYSPRDIYRPGETLIFSALLRSSAAGAVPGVPLQARLIQPDGRVVSSQNIQPEALNYYEVRLPLPTDAATGEWRFRIVLPDGTERDYPVQIETFLPERLALTLQTDERLQPDANFTVEVQGDYLYGAPASGNRLQSQLIAKLEPHPFEAFKDFYFGHPNDTELERWEDLQEVELDEKGRADLEVESYWKELTSPLSLTAYISLLDSGGRPVSRRATSVVMPADTLPGIRPLFEKDVVDYEGDAAFELVLTNGIERLASEGLDVSLIRERRDYHWSWSDAEGWQSQYTERHYTVDQRSVSLKAGDSTEISFPTEWGYYRIEVKDPASGQVSAYRFRAGWDPDAKVMAGRPDRVGLTLNQQQYSAGDELRIQVRPPAAGEGYLMLETDQLLYREPISIPAEGAEVSVKLKPEWLRQDLFASVVLLQPGDERERTLPRRMLGLEPVPVAPGERELQVNFGEMPVELRPEQRVEVPIQVSAAQSGELPDEVRVTLAAVDVGVLSITDFATPDPLEWFFTPGAYRVDLRDNYGDLIDAEAGALARLRYGGDADLSRGGAQPPSDVQILSLFSGAVDVDEQGQASIPVDLPAFNGRIRLMAVAFSDEALGSADHEVPVVAPVVAELNRPRFLAQGDESQLTLDLHNRTEQTQTLSVELKAGKGLVFKSGATAWQAEIELDAGEKVTQVLPVTANIAMGKVPLRLHVGGIEGEADLNREWSLGVRPAWPAQSLNWQQPVVAGASFDLSGAALEGLQPDSLNAQLSLSRHAPLNLARHFDALKAYPYGCAEQTTSGVFPQIYVQGNQLQDWGLKADAAEERTAAVELAIRRLFGMQRSNGSFGLWSDQSPEEPWLSVYITDFLLRARDAGYTVSEPGLKLALEQVARYLRHPNRINGELLHDRRSRVAVRAYAAQVLARSGQAPLAELRNLLDHHAENTPPLAMLQLGLALRAAGDQRRAEQALDRALVALSKDKFDHTDYGSLVRDRALALFWLLEADSPETQWVPVLDRLQTSLSGRQWFSTQERNALFLAGNRLANLSGDSVEVHLTGIWDKVLSGQGSYSLSARGADVLQGLELENPADHALWFNLKIQGYTTQPPAAISQGMKVERRFLNAKGQPLDISTLKTGDQVLVELQVHSEDPVSDALIVDLLPAGLELENQNLANSMDAGDLQVEGNRITDLMAMLDLRHQEYRDDRYVAALKLGYGGARLYYLARAVTPGEYRVPPSFAESMYTPEIRHQGGDSQMMVIRAR